MKKSIQALIMAATMLAGAMVFTSCEEILGEWSRPAPNPVTPTPDPTPKNVVKATDLLKEAQKEGANVVFWYHYEGGLFYAVFKKVGDVYVYQEGGNCNKASTRGSVVETQLTTELLKLKGDGADLGFNVYSADDAGNKNDPIILCKVYSSTAEVKQKTNSPDNYLAAMAANIQNISMKTIMDDVKDIFNGDNKEYQPDNKNLENVLLVTADDNTDQLLFKSLPEIEKNAAEQGISPEKAIGATIDNLKQNVKEKYEDGSLKLGNVYLEDEKPSVTFDPNDASKNTYLQELKTTGVGTVTYTLSESLNTCGATIDSKSGEVTFTKPGEVTVIAKFTNNDGFYIYAYYTLTINKAPGSISYSEKDAQIKKTVGDDDFTIELEKVGDGVVTYSSSKETVATVNAEGKVKIVGPGKTTITATIKEDTDCYHYETKTASYELEVETPVTDSSVNDPDDYADGGDPTAASN
jgi:hypothetical protein